MIEVKNEKFRSRSFMLLLYPNSNSNHSDVLNYIVRSYLDIIYISHDKDLNNNADVLSKDKTETDFKKEHTHLIIRFDNARWNTAVAKEFNLEIRFIQSVNNLNLALGYLIHFNDKDKHQYSLDDLKGGYKLKEHLKKYINNHDKSETDKITELISLIVQEEDYLTITRFSMICAELGYWDIYRRNALILHNIIKENNKF